MTPDQQRETALRLYRLAWRFPEQAPEPIDASCSGDYEINGYAPYYVKAGAIFVEAFVCDASYARVDVGGRIGHKLVIEGPTGYVETMLRAIPYSLRPHVEASDGKP